MAVLGATLVVCALLSIVTGTETDCSFEYIRQPPSATLDGCDPYQTSLYNNKVLTFLECTIRRRAMVNDEFEVRWFRENTTGTVEDLGLGEPNEMLGMDWFSRYHDSAFRTQPYSTSLLGKYWCQVINTTADPDQPLMRSNVFTLLAPGNYSGATCTTTTTQSQFVDNQTCADLTKSQLPGQPTPPVFQPITTLLLTSTTTSVVQTLTMKSSDNTLMFTPYSTTDQTNVNHTIFADVVNHMTTTSPPSPSGSVTVVQLSITPIVAGVTAGVVIVLILIIFSTLVMILIVMKKKKMMKHEKQQTHTGSYSNNAVSYNICSEPEDTVKIQSNNTTSQPPSVIYDQPDDLKRSMSVTKEGGNIINSEYSCLTDATTSGPPGPGSAAPVLFDDPMYDATGVSNNQYSLLENAATGADSAYSKLGYNQAATNTPPMELTADDQYSSLNTSSNTMGRDKLAAGYGEQEYSSLQHPGVPPAPSDMTSADQQQYSVLNKS